MRPPAQRTGGFSLMEVVIAIGVISFAIIGLLSLLTTALQFGRQAADDSLVASMAHSIIAELRATPFLELQPAADKEYFFDSEGIRCEEGNATYRCSVAVSVPDFEGGLQAEANCRAAKLTFFSPPRAAKPNTETLHATISNLR